jgi:hypothetical protein
MAAIPLCEALLRLRRGVSKPVCKQGMSCFKFILTQSTQRKIERKVRNEFVYSFAVSTKFFASFA